jgi:hypothetical protein
MTLSPLGWVYQRYNIRAGGQHAAQKTTHSHFAHCRGTKQNYQGFHKHSLTSTKLRPQSPKRLIPDGAKKPAQQVYWLIQRVKKLSIAPLLYLLMEKDV